LAKWVFREDKWTSNDHFGFPFTQWIVFVERLTSALVALLLPIWLPQHLGRCPVTFFTRKGIFVFE
jgi:hypothetical protein